MEINVSLLQTEQKNMPIMSSCWENFDTSVKSVLISLITNGHYGAIRRIPQSHHDGMRRNEGRLSEAVD